tara:strand:- start:799 stop:1014 length:216 start_codon:yes stop_codon:yes gene_type:complete
MKFILAYTICSAISGMCNTPSVHPTPFNTWSDCTKHGAMVTIKTTNDFLEKFNDQKLYVSYFCSEHKGEDA